MQGPIPLTRHETSAFSAFWTVAWSCTLWLTICVTAAGAPVAGTPVAGIPAAGVPAAGAPVADRQPGATVVVETIPDTCPLSGSELMAGDRLLSWRLGDEQGTFQSPFDWEILVLDGATRGSVVLGLQREGRAISIEAPRGDWQTRVRWSMPAEDLATYRRGLRWIEQDRLNEGVEQWRTLADGGSPFARWVQFQIGQAFFDHNQWVDAQGAFHAASASAPKTLADAVVAQALAWAYFQHRDLETAREIGELALERRRSSAPGSLQVADSLMRLGIVALDKGRDLARASSLLEQALAIQERQAGESSQATTILLNLGRVEAKRGHLDRAADLYRRVLTIRRAVSPDGFAPTGVLNNLGVLALNRGNLDQAEEYLREALEIRERLKPGSRHVANCLNNLGNVARKRGDLERAFELHRRALEIREKLKPGTPSHASSLHNLGSVAFAQGDLTAAADFFRRALEISHRRLPGSLKVATHLGRLGQIEVQEGRLDRGIELFEQALEIQQRLAPKSTAEADTLHSLADVFLRKNERERALDLLREGMNALDGQMNRLGGSRSTQAGFRSQFGRLYHDAISLAVELGSTEEAFQMLERSRARTFLAQLAERDLKLRDVPEALELERRESAHQYDETQGRLARLDPETQQEDIEALRTELARLMRRYEDLTAEMVRASPTLASLQSPEPLDLAAARQALDPGTALIAFDIGVDQAHVFVVTLEEGLRALKLPIEKRRLQADVERVLRLQKPRTTPYSEPLQEVSRRLYRELLEPIEPWIAGSERWVIVPDGPLHVLPFPLLERSGGARGRQYLVEWKPIHTVLSATVYGELKSRRDGLESKPEGMKLAVFGDPDYSARPAASTDGKGAHRLDAQVRSAAERGFGFRPLPFSRREATRIADLFPEGAVDL